MNKEIYKKVTKHYTARIETLPNDKYSKYVAVFVTAKGIVPRSYVAFPFNTEQGCYDMFEDMIGKMKRYYPTIKKFKVVH